MSAREVRGKREGKWNLSPTTRTLNHNYQPPPSCCSLVVAERARLRHLPWGDPTAAAAVRAELAPAGFDVVLGADVLYSEAAVPRLLASLACLLAPGGVAVLCYQERGVSGRAALAAAAAAGLAKVQPPPCLAAAADSAAVGGAHLLRLLCLCRAGEEEEGGA